LITILISISAKGWSSADEIEIKNPALGRII